MAWIPHEFIYRGDLAATGPFHSQVFVDALADGEIVGYYVEAAGVSAFSGDWFFGLQKNGVDILTTTERPQITSGDLEVEVTGLTEAVSFRDRLTPTIDERGAGVITGPITVIIWISPTDKAVPDDADTVAITDPVDGKTKSVTWANLITAVAAAINSFFVALTGDQTIAGIKTFSSSPVVPTPTTSGQAANKSYVDGVAAGLSWKTYVRAATVAAGTLATSFENGDTIDGVVLATGDRILIQDQATSAENGIYVVNASGAPTRATDADTGTELVNASVYVAEGTVNADKQFVCTTNAPITINVTGLTYTEFSSGGGLVDSDYGDITVSGSGSVMTIDNDAVTYAKMQNVSATSRVLGRKTAAAGDVEEVTLSELLDFIGSAAQGDLLYRGAAGWSRLAAGTSGHFLKTQGAGADPLWQAIAGGGDLLAANNLSDVANAATARANLGLAIGTNVQAFSAILSLISVLSDPGGDKMLFWDESANAFDWLEPASNLAISGTDLNASGGGGGGMTWTEVTGTSQSAAGNNGYITNNGALVTVTLPATSAVGEVIAIQGLGAGGWKIAQNASQQVRWNEGGVDGVNETTVGTGGSVEAVDQYDAVEIICLVTDTVWGFRSVKAPSGLTLV
jgi:hypothetical protein